MPTLRPAVPPPLRPGAVVHGPGSTAVDAMIDRFVTELQRRGFRVGGVIQRNTGAPGDCADLMELVDVATGQAYDISQHLGRQSQSCRVDPQGVAEASQALRRAIAERADLLVVNKFAGLEAHGEGLADELLAGIAEGIPVLTSVGSRFLNEWQSFTGGFTSLISPHEDALWRWWGAHRLYDDLLHGVEDAEVRAITVGAKWIMVETDSATGRGIGLAARPQSAPPPDPARWAGVGLAGLAAHAARSWDPQESAVGMAALNAHYNRPDLTGPTANGLDLFAGMEGRVVVFGAFPQIARRLPNAHVVDMNPSDGEYPEAAGEWLLPGAEGAAITASTLTNRTLPRLLSVAQGTRVALVGPGTPLTPRLFRYGVAALSGFVVEDRDAVAEAILAGGSSQSFHRHGRFVTLYNEQN
ncbi:DUF2478 domain-containing protein [Azospirillum formosense]|uniref:DUF2478 domain-containing protein n=1 Tax=Azospirillum formosense TaxID=861533 RepID=UPI001C91F5FC|nr:DUF2478 domain-containing protein [Azospirillum formosense]MBY3755572.1 DUF2478 domain-containing protein [Azospirillum formosense]